MSPLNVTSLHLATVNTVKVGRKKNLKGGKGNKTGLEVPTLSGRNGETPKAGKGKGGKGKKSLHAWVASTSRTMTTSPSTLPEASAVSTSTSTISPVLDVNVVPKRKRKEVETGPEELGPRKRKATKRARGIEYNESTPSDEERRNEVAPATKS
jgi:hypothetical protein